MRQSKGSVRKPLGVRGGHRPCEASVIHRRGYSLMDVLVSLTVMAVLLSLLAPALSGVRETTRRVVCGSNSRQLGMGLSMFADSHRGMLPDSVASLNRTTSPSSVGVARLSGPTLGAADSLALRLNPGVSGGSWDGLGMLYSGDFLPNPGVFYCPSHRGEHPLARYTSTFMLDQGEIIGNYQFRGTPPNGAMLLAMYPGRLGMIADGMRTVADVNHLIGANVLSGDMSVSWYSDETTQALAALSRSPNDAKASERVLAAWSAMDNQIAAYAVVPSTPDKGRDPLAPGREDRR